MSYCAYPQPTTMDTITNWLNAAGSKALDRTQSEELLAKLQRTEKDSKQYTQILNRICEGNLLLVYKTVQGYCNKRNIRWGTELSADLLQVGYLGLRHAATRYDAKKGRLSTIAVPWIKQKLGRYLNRQEATIYVPETMVYEAIYYKQHGEYSNSRTAPKNKKLVDMAVAATARALSLDMPMGEDGDCTFADTIEARDTSNSGAKLDKQLLEIKDLMAQAGIEPRVQDFILLYSKGGRLSTAAARAGLTEPYARKSYKDAMAKLQALV